MIPCYSCSVLSVCIGRFFPKLKAEFPDQFIDLHFHSYEAPIVQMQTDDVRINVTFAVDFYIHPRKEHLKNLARIGQPLLCFKWSYFLRPVYTFTAERRHSEGAVNPIASRCFGL